MKSANKRNMSSKQARAVRKEAKHLQAIKRNEKHVQAKLSHEIKTLVKERKIAKEHATNKKELLMREVARFRHRLEHLGLIHEITNSKNKDMRTISKMIEHPQRKVHKNKHGHKSGKNHHRMKLVQKSAVLEKVPE